MNEPSHITRHDQVQKITFLQAVGRLLEGGTVYLRREDHSYRPLRLKEDCLYAFYPRYHQWLHCSEWPTLDDAISQDWYIEVTT